MTFLRLVLSPISGMHYKCNMIFFILITILCLPSSTCAEWTIYKRIHVKNQNRDLLRFDVVNNGNVRAWLILKPGENGAFETNLPLYKVDNNKVHDLFSVFSDIATPKSLLSSDIFACFGFHVRSTLIVR